VENLDQEWEWRGVAKAPAGIFVFICETKRDPVMGGGSATAGNPQSRARKSPKNRGHLLLRFLPEKSGLVENNVEASVLEF